MSLDTKELPHNMASAGTLPVSKPSEYPAETMIYMVVVLVLLMNDSE